MRIKSLCLLFILALATAVLAIVPTFTSVTPTVAQQGAIKSLAIVGTNFESSTTIEVSGSGVLVTSCTTESSTNLTANVVISATAAVGARNIVIYNSGEAGVTAANAFTVTASGTGPAISQVKFDHVLYTVPMIAAIYPTVTVNPTYEVHFKVTSTLPATLSADSLNASVLTAVVTGDTASIFDLHTFTTSVNTAITTKEMTVASSTEINVFATIEAGAHGITRGQILQIFINSYDASGGSSLESFLIYSAQQPTNDNPPIKPVASVEAAIKDKVVVVPEVAKVDPNKQTTVSAYIAIAQGQSIQNFSLWLFSPDGSVAARQQYRLATPATNQYKVSFALNEARKSKICNGMFRYKVIDDDNQRVIGGGRQVFFVQP